MISSFCKRCCSCICAESKNNEKRGSRIELALSPFTDKGNAEALEDMQLRPSEVDIQLESAIEKWERAINDYRDYEESVIEQEGEDSAVIVVLDELREAPEKFMTGYPEKIRNLAVKRSLIYSWQAKLGLSREPSGISSSSSSSSSLSPLHFHASFSSSSSSSLKSIKATTATSTGSDGGSKSSKQAGINISSSRNMGSEGDTQSPRKRAQSARIASVAVPIDPLINVSLNTLRTLTADSAYSEHKTDKVGRVVL